MPPDVGGGLAARGFGGTDELGRHVRDAVGGAQVEGVLGGVAGVPEEVVVLGGPFLAGAGAVVVGPDDLVLEAGSAGAAVEGEDLVEQDLAVVDFARIDVKEEGAVWGEDAVGLFEARLEESEEVVEGIGIAGERVCGDLGTVALAGESGAVAGFIPDSLQARTDLLFSGC